jgi:hypothetical protein
VGIESTLSVEQDLSAISSVPFCDVCVGRYSGVPVQGGAGACGERLSAVKGTVDKLVPPRAVK